MSGFSIPILRPRIFLIKQTNGATLGEARNVLVPGQRLPPGL